MSVLAFSTQTRSGIVSRAACSAGHASCRPQFPDRRCRYRRASRAHGAAAVDQVFPHALVGGTECDAADRLRRHLQAGRRDVSAAVRQRRVDPGIAVYRRDFEAHAEFVGETPRQIVLRPSGESSGPR